MNRDGKDEQRRTTTPVPVDRRGALWSLPDGYRLPNALDTPVLVVGDPHHPARLRPDDLENPEDFHLRLTTWLLHQS